MKRIFYKSLFRKLSKLSFLFTLGILIKPLSTLSGQNAHIVDAGEIIRLESTSSSGWLSFYQNNIYKGYLWSTGDNIQLASNNGNLNLFGNKIGLGTSSPKGKVEIAYNSTVGNPHLYLDETGSDFARVTLRNGTGNAYWDFAGASNIGTPQLNFYYDNGAGTARNYMRILPVAQNFEIYGDLTPQNTAFDLGNNNASEHWDDCVADDFINFSDRRLKENITPVGSVLSQLLMLSPVKYRYIKSFNPDNRERTGLIAQDVQKIFPSIIINEDVDIDEKTHERSATQSDYLSMNYIELIPIIIKGIQEQQSIVDSQKTYIETLENRISALEQGSKVIPVSTVASKK